MGIHFSFCLTRRFVFFTLTSQSNISKTFDQYASADGDKGSLSKAEVKKLMETELPGLMKACKNPGAVDTLMKSLDHNGDASVDFQEFVVLVTALCCACHDRVC